MAGSKDLLNVLWSGADVLRGKMDANEYKTYLLGLIFYKYLSDSYLSKVYDLLNDEKPPCLEEALDAYKEAMREDDAKEFLDEIKNTLHYTLTPGNSVRLETIAICSMVIEVQNIPMHMIWYQMESRLLTLETSKMVM